MNLCFDCDDTLYDLEIPFKKAVDRVLPFITIDTETLFKTYRKMGDTVFDLEHKHIITNDDVGIYRVYEACKVLGIPITLEQAADFQDAYKENQKHIAMVPCLHEYFAHCDKKIAILTNGQDNHQKDKVYTLGMQQYVPEDLIFSSEGIGYAKPDPRVFYYVAEYTHTKNEDWFYIGDNYTTDIEGAHNAGWHTIHFNRHHCKEGPCADILVYSEVELVEALRKIGRKGNEI